MEVVGVLEQGIVFGIQIPQKEVGIYFIFLGIKQFEPFLSMIRSCLLYTSDAADE